MGKRPRIAIIGVGGVGSTLGFILAQKGIGDIILLDIIKGWAKGKALDIMQALPLFHSNVMVVGTESYSDIRNSDVVVIACGFPRKPGFKREDVLQKNAKIIRDVAKQVARYAKDALVLVVTNPLDVITYVFTRISKFPKQRVIGMGGVLDSARFRFFIAKKLGVSSQHVTALVIGAHGDSMIPIVRFSSVFGVPLTEFFSKSEMAEIVERTRFGGEEIVTLLQTGSTAYAPASAIAFMIESILSNSSTVLPCSVLLNGEYGCKDVAIGVPIRLDHTGVRDIIELPLTPVERKLFHRSACFVREAILKV